MKRVLCLMTAVVVFCFLGTTIFAVNIDTPWVNRIQPDGTEFIGRDWGDEFAMQSETQDGYKYLIDHTTGYFVYANLGENGEFTETQWKVGIDDPSKHGIMKGLDRSPLKKAEIEAAREEYHTQLTKINRTSAGKIAKRANGPLTWELDVILVEFNDISGDTNYNTSDFEEMLYSDDYDDEGDYPDDDESVYGSVRQYYETISNGNFVFDIVNSNILNDSVNDKPVWLTVSYSKNACIQMQPSAVEDIFIAAAEQANLVVMDDLGEQGDGRIRILCFIYAGNLRTDKNQNYPYGGLHPHANPQEHFYIVSEKVDSDWSSYNTQQEVPGATFTHIGLHCHEIGHMLGTDHPTMSAGRWCVMRGGDKNGPRIFRCPAPMNPIFREHLEWLSFQNVTVATDNLQIQSGYSYAYSIKEYDSVRDYEIICEHKTVETDNFDKFVLSEPLDDDDLGLFVWISNTVSPNSDIDLVNADDAFYEVIEGVSTANQIAAALGDPFPGTSTVTEASDYTTPDFEVSSRTFKPHLLLDNITWSATYTTLDALINYWEGEIDSYTQWRDTVIVGDDITVNADKTLAVQSSAIVKTVVGKKIEVNGTLDLRSNSKLTSYSTTWYGLYVGSTGVLDVNGETTIENAYTGLKINNTNGFDNNDGAHLVTFRDCTSYGIQVIGSLPTIKNVYAENTNGFGVIGSQAQPTFRNVTLTEGGYGFYMSNTDAILLDSDITIYNAYASIMLYSTNANIDLGSIPGYGCNNIHPKPIRKAIDAINCKASVLAHGNWWGTSIPPPGLFNDSLTVDTSYALPDSNTAAGAGKPAVNNSLYLLAQAWELEDAGDFTGATALYKKMLETEKDPDRRRRHIKSLIRLRERSGGTYEDIVSIIESEMETAEPGYYAILDYLLCMMPMKEGDIGSTISLLEKRANVYSGTPMEQEMLCTLASVHGHLLNDPDIARSYADRVAMINPGCRLLDDAYDSAGIFYESMNHEDRSIGFRYTEKHVLPEDKEEKPAIPTLAVTPNPANPSTTIRYTIVQSGTVSLAVYSVSGQKVATLVDGFMPAGTHAAVFDGSSLASGLYLYRFEATGFAKTGKIVLVK